MGKSRNFRVVKEASDVQLDHILPDEDPAEFIRLRDDLLAELGPKTEYQRCVAMSIIMVEWELKRHRRLIAVAIRDEFRTQSGAVLSEGSPGYRFFYNEWFSSATGRDLLAGDADALERVRQTGVTLTEITAAALERRFKTIAYHETRIADLEKRRRSLRPEYEAMKAKRPPNDEIEDAVEVN